MTSPYAVAPTTAPAQERRPSYEDLELRVQEGGYGSHRDRMDSREWYELCYFTPLEDFLYEALEAKYYPKMDARNIAVCVSVWIYAHSVSEPVYERVKDRILWSDNYDMGAEVIRGRTGPETAIRQTLERGFITSIHHSKGIILRQDIEQFLSDLVDKECAESDAAILAANGKEAWEELQEFHRKQQLEFWRECVRFLSRQNEKGEHIPLTEGEQKEWLESMVERYDRRITD